jgi:hypothetical protein
MGCTAPQLRSVNAGVSKALRPVAKTSAPSEAKRLAMACPMPLFLPIATATLFDNLFIDDIPCRTRNSR